MHYTVYKITNLLNGMFYIGRHKTACINDKYMGSGTRLLRAIKKYGTSSFLKQILFDFKTPEEMEEKEAELVTEEFCRRNDTYNIVVGGRGGRFLSGENARNASRLGAAKKAWLWANDESYRDRTSKNISAAQKIREISSFAGKKHTNETKKKMSSAKRGLNIGANNSQFGTFWITDGLNNKKIKKEADIPSGWYRGRVLSFKQIGRVAQYG